MKTYHYHWPNAIILVDMNAFFASVEQMDFPEWRGRPVVVTNGEAGTCIITSSYEARQYGIKTGMRLKQAYQLCPDLIRAPSRPWRYAEMSNRIMESLQSITPDIEVFSIDEAFLDVTHCQYLYKSPIEAAEKVKKAVFDATGLLCSVGLSGDKTTAKYAAQLRKPNGFSVIEPWKAEKQLQDVPVQKLCGIGAGIARFLAQYGVITCGDMAKLPISILAKRFGNVGRRLWYMCQGADPEPVHCTVPAPKTMGHGKVLPPNTSDPRVLQTYLQHICERLAARLRFNEMTAQRFFIGMRSQDWGWLGGKYQLKMVSNDGRDIYQLCRAMLHTNTDVGAIRQVQVTALDPRQRIRQLDLFMEIDEQRQRVNHVVDAINDRFGEFRVSPGRLLNRSSIPNVISPAWRPKGHRNTIPKNKRVMSSA